MASLDKSHLAPACTLSFYATGLTGLSALAIGFLAVVALGCFGYVAFFTIFIY